MTEAPDLLGAGLSAMRAQAEHDALDRIAADADEAARHALEHYADDQWLEVDFAEAMLVAARALRKANRTPSPAVVEAMERCTSAHRAWAEAWPEDETAAIARALARPTDKIATETDAEPIRVKIGLGDIVKGVLQARRS